MWEEMIWGYLKSETVELIEWAKCGEGVMSVIPTALWAAGSAALAHRLLTALFRRFVFRRVPLWEVILQNLLFVWIVIYSLHFWLVLVRVLKILVDYWYEEDDTTILLTEEEVESRKLMQQWLIWMCGVSPLAAFVQTRPRAEAPPLMIWITTSPWQRREMGPYGYYLSRPPAPPAPRAAPPPRRALSDGGLPARDLRKKRYSKSV